MSFAEVKIGTQEILVPDDDLISPEKSLYPRYDNMDQQQKSPYVCLLAFVFIFSINCDTALSKFRVDGNSPFPNL